MITVKRPDDTGALGHFRLLQGKNADKIITKK